MYEIEDNCSNVTECSVVYSGGDTEAPALVDEMITCSSLDVDDQNICLRTASSFNGETLETAVAALYSDNCDMAVTASLIDTVHTAGNTDCEWTITYNYEIEDNCSNVTECSVVYSGGDTEAPALVDEMITCSSLDVDDQNICLSTASAFNGEILETAVAARYSDNCDMAVTASLFDTVHTAGNTDCEWTITYNYEIEDNCSNVTECSVVYSGGDTEAPALVDEMITCSSLDVDDQNICLSTASAFNGEILETAVAARYSDNCDMAVTATLVDTVHTAGNSDCSWTITYMYEIEDNCSNVTECSVVYSGGDTEAPALVDEMITCSSLDVDDQNICLSTASSFNGETLETAVAALYSDNCDMAVMASLIDTVHTAGNTDCEWIITYNYEIEDNCSNVTECSVVYSGGDTEA